MLGSLCSGQVRVTGLGDGADNRGTARAFGQLGVDMRSDGDALVIDGVGLHGLQAPAAELDFGNSGTTIRLMCGILAAQSFGCTVTGDESLRGRPMRRVIDPLSRMGARITGVEGAKPGEVYPPLTFAPADRLVGADYDMPIASGQVKSALLLAGLYAQTPTRVGEPGPSRDHTERMLRYLSAPVESAHGMTMFDPDSWDHRLEPRPIHVPGDPSSAAFPIAAALIAGGQSMRIEEVCTNATRTGFLDVLAEMGALVTIEPRHESSSGEPTADLVVVAKHAAPVKATEVRGDLLVRSLDEVPVLAVVAACGEGVTWFRDAAELRVKESDRIETTAAMLRAFGVEVEVEADAFAVHGRGGAPLSAAEVDAAGDHRIAMAAAVAALRADGPCRIDDAANVATSFPGFAALMNELGARVDVET